MQIKVGPDGAIYICDFYEQRIDHASHFQGRVTPDSGRIYRLRAANAKPSQCFDLSRLSSLELLSLLTQQNKWYRQTAQRLLADRQDVKIQTTLTKRLEENSSEVSLEYLWALNGSNGLDNDTAIRCLRHPNPHVRLWTVRLLCDSCQVSEKVSRELAQIAEQEENVEVRCQLACSARRLPAIQALPIVRKLIEHEEDVGDVFLPLLLWWAVESKVEQDPSAVLALFQSVGFWKQPIVKQHLAERLIRRFALAGTQQDLVACTSLLQQAPTAADAKILLKGFEAAYAGRSMVNLPKELVTALTKAGGDSMTLRLRRRDPQAINEALKLARNDTAQVRTELNASVF